MNEHSAVSAGLPHRSHLEMTPAADTTGITPFYLHWQNCKDVRRSVPSENSNIIFMFP